MWHMWYPVEDKKVHVPDLCFVVADKVKLRIDGVHVCHAGCAVGGEVCTNSMLAFSTKCGQSPSCC